MNRLNILLLLVVLACALSVVDATNQQRQIFVDLQHAQAQEYRLHQDYAQLQYQQSALSKTSRIESVATTQLKMVTVAPGRTQYLAVDPATVSITDAAPVTSGASAAASAVRGSGSSRAGVVR